MSEFPLGYIPADKRNRAQHETHDRCMAAMPQQFRLTGAIGDKPEYLNYMELWKHDRVKKALGAEFTGVYQKTGSCVGAGGGNALMSLVCTEVLIVKEQEEIVLPFWLYPYGKSRELIGEQTEGEGSFGSAFAEACKQFGVFGNLEEGLPKPSTSDGYVWGEREEMRWSNGRAVPPKWVDLGKTKLVRTTAPLRSVEQVIESLTNGYLVTCAFNNYCGPRGARVQGTGDDACVIGTLDTYGPHQTSYQAYWKHPKFGELLWNENQWSRTTYPRCPRVGRGTGVWQRAEEVDEAIRNRSMNAELFSLSAYDGYPARTIKIDWSQLGA